MKNGFLTLLLIIITACSGSDDNSYSDIPSESVFKTTPLEFKVPSNFPELTYDIDSNPPTKEGFELGKRLFFEAEMSSDGLISCGECHRQEFAFTHHKHIVSHGVDGKLGTRNAQPLHNMAFMKEFSWDGAVENLDMFPISPITNEVEMNETVSNVLAKLNKIEKYKKLYAAAFENGKIDTENTLKALAQFTVMMVSADSKYDRAIRNEGGVTLNEEEKQGKLLFDQKCAACHSGELFTDQSYRNNGLPIDPKYNDTGRERATGDPVDRYKFKVPSLRNIELTLPYMHDGRFKSLKSVLDYYADGVTETKNLDPLLKKDGKLGIPLTEDEKSKIISFLLTLTDNTFANDRRFAEF